MDDFVVFGSSFDNYLENFQKVLKRCEDKKLVLDWEKYHFLVTSGIILGPVISADGIQVDKAKIDLISGLHVRKSVRDIRSFFGHTGFYKRFIKDFNTIS